MAETKKKYRTNTRKKAPALYVAPENPWRKRKIGCPEEMAALWDEYKFECDTHTTLKSYVDNGMLSNIEVNTPRTYTIKGFCLYIGMTESNFHNVYKKDELYSDVIEMIDMEIELDARGKFEDGSLNAKLAPLWMAHHKGYSAKTETEVKGGVPVVISGEDKLKD